MYNAKATRHCKCCMNGYQYRLWLMDLLKVTFAATPMAKLNIFIAHSNSTKLARGFSNITFMYCIYKTNRSAYHFCTSLGAHAWTRLFNCLQFFMSGEDVDSYKWALHQACRVYKGGQLLVFIVIDAYATLAMTIECQFPHACHLLYIWHIKKNVLAKTKKYLMCGQHHKESIN